MKKVDVGIYRSWKSKLYFVRESSNDGNHPLDDELCLVNYHPLYPVENIGWRYRRFNDFFAEVNHPELNYSGPKFKKIMDWKEPNILPGCRFRDTANQSHGLCAIIQVVEKSTTELIVEAYGLNGHLNIEIEAFSLQRLMLV